MQFFHIFTCVSVGLQSRSKVFAVFMYDDPVKTNRKHFKPVISRKCHGPGLFTQFCVFFVPWYSVDVLGAPGFDSWLMLWAIFGFQDVLVSCICIE